MVKGQSQPVLAGMSSAVANVVRAITVSVEYFIPAQAIFGAYLVVVVSQGHDRAKQQQEGSPFQPGG